MFIFRGYKYLKVLKNTIKLQLFVDIVVSADKTVSRGVNRCGCLPHSRRCPEKCTAVVYALNLLLTLYEQMFYNAGTGVNYSGGVLFGRKCCY